MEHFTVAMFGEAEKGQFCTAYFCRSLEQLVECLGNPPPQSRGLYFAIQALMYDRDLIFIRVEEEGFSEQDYFSGLYLLEKQDLFAEIDAIGIPGVGNDTILEAVSPLCTSSGSIILSTEADLYDYLTERAA